MQRTRKHWAGNERWLKKHQLSLANVVVVLHLDLLRKMEISFLFSAAAEGFLGPQEKHQIRVFFLYGQEQNAKFRYDQGVGGEVIYCSKYLFLAAVHVLANRSSSVLRRITASVITNTFCVQKPCPRGCQLAWALSTYPATGVPASPKSWLCHRCLLASLPGQKKKWRHSPVNYKGPTGKLWKDPKSYKLGLPN